MSSRHRNMRGLVVLIVKFLRDELKNHRLDDDCAEGVEVAVQCLETAYGVNESDVNEATFDLLDMYYTRLARAEVDRVITDEDREMAEALKVKGNKCMNQAKFKDALGYYKRAIEVDPKNPVYFCNRAAAHIQMHNYLAARNDCLEAIRLDPNYSKAYSRIGYAYQAVGQTDKAKEYYSRAMALDPTNESYKASYQKLVDPGKVESGTSSSGSLADLTDHFPGVDFSAIMKSPGFVQMASQLLGDPAMQTALNHLISDDSGYHVRQVEELLGASQHLASFQRAMGLTKEQGSATQEQGSTQHRQGSAPQEQGSAQPEPTQNGDAALNQHVGTSTETVRPCLSSDNPLNPIPQSEEGPGFTPEMERELRAQAERAMNDVDHSGDN